MESPRYVQEKDKTQRKEDVTEQHKSDREKIDIYKPESYIRLTERSEGPITSKSHKKHCNWKSTSDTYCPNTKLFKNYHVYRKAYDRLEKYVKDEPRTFDLPQKYETLSR